MDLFPTPHPAMSRPSGAEPEEQSSIDPPICLPALPSDSRCEQWSTQYSNPGGNEFDGPDGTSGYAGIDRVLGIAVSDSGSRVFVTGVSFDAITGYDAATAAFDASTGDRLWLARHDGPGGRPLLDGGAAILVDGPRVFVTGYQDFELRAGQPPRGEFLTLAYDATSGEKLWAASKDASPQGDTGSSIAISPDGDDLYVSGSFDARANALAGDIGTVAYDARTGEERWATVYDGGYGDYPLAVSVSPDGDHVLVGATSFYQIAPDNPSLTLEFVAISYGADGAEDWHSSYHSLHDTLKTAGGHPIGLIAQGTAAMFGPDAVYITGIGDKTSTLEVDAIGTTVAWDASSGEQRWARNSLVGAATVHMGGGISNTGDGVFVTGLVTDSMSLPSVDYDIGTWALDPATGSQIWFSRYKGIQDDWAWGTSVSVPRDGGRVFVAGISVTWAPHTFGQPVRGDYATIAYNAATGAEAWAGRYNGSPLMTDLEADPRVSVRAAHDGTRVFVAGTLLRQPSGTNYSDYGMWAYRAD